MMGRGLDSRCVRRITAGNFDQPPIVLKKGCDPF